MKREIKFRRWAKRANEMVYPGGVFLQNFFRVIDDDIANHIDNYIVMQYVGLKDKNRKDIYEGDIISHMQGDQEKPNNAILYNGVVKFHAGAFYISANGIFTNIYLHDIDGNWSVNRRWEGYGGRKDIYEFASGFEVIGNIYENPELLKPPNQ